MHRRLALLELLRCPWWFDQHAATVNESIVRGEPGACTYASCNAYCALGVDQHMPLAKPRAVAGGQLNLVWLRYLHTCIPRRMRIRTGNDAYLGTCPGDPRLSVRYSIISRNRNSTYLPFSPVEKVKVETFYDSCLLLNFLRGALTLY